MDLTQGTPDGGSLSAINGNWVLAQDSATGRFARRFTFALPTGGLADGFRWQPNTACTLSFPTYDYDARGRRRTGKRHAGQTASATASS